MEKKLLISISRVQSLTLLILNKSAKKEGF